MHNFIISFEEECNQALGDWKITQTEKNQFPREGSVITIKYPCLTAKRKFRKE